ncbi:MAG: transcriptional regulator [Beduini sp.]|uniref:helix-turn-helix transcriptional regulator n=1 Tax=Beduini sp. TaxID=1922300 RepID=UPI0039A1A606
MHPILEPYAKFVDFLGEALGDNVEIALHDLTTKNKEIVALRNGQISGRDINSGLSSLAVHLLDDKQYLTKDYVFNYKTVGADGKLLRAATYFIKDGQNAEPVGMICINVDITDFNYIEDTLKKILGIKDETPAEFGRENPIEVLSNSLDETVERYIKEALEEMGFPSYFLPERLKVDEKIKVVKFLQEKGTFKVKGALVFVANKLGVSEPTIYRYLKKDAI